MIMPPEQKGKTTELTWEERRVRRLLRREKQRKDNIGRAAKMHAARLRMERVDHGKPAAGLKASAYVGCSGWFYWKWWGLFYPDDLPTGEWFRRPMTALGRVSRASPIQTAVRNCTRDEGGPFEAGSQVLASSHRKLLLPKAMVVSVAETPGRDPGRHACTTLRRSRLTVSLP
jgi:hypothetical protein